MYQHGSSKVFGCINPASQATSRDLPGRAFGALIVDARDWRSGFISRADVADFLVKQIGDASLVTKR